MVDLSPSKILLFTVPLVLGITLINPGQAFDIQIHDTYYVIPNYFYGIYSALILAALSLIYFLLENRKLIHWLNILHIAISITLSLLIVIGIASLNFFKENHFEPVYRKTNDTIPLFIGIFILGQSILIFNLLISFALYLFNKYIK